MPKSMRGVMKEWKTGNLHSGSSSGPVVKKQKQAVAIALSDQRQQEKPAKAQMHPAMQQRAQMVKTSHAHLAATVPGFSSMPKKNRMMAVQAHVRSRMGK